MEIESLKELRSNGLLIKNYHNPTDDQVVTAVTSCPEAIEYISQDLFTSELVRRLLKINPEFIFHFPMTYVTQNRLLKAIKHAPSSAQKLTDDHYTLLNAKDLIRVTYRVYPYLRSNDITEELCKYSVVRYTNLYANIPEVYKTKQFNREVVQKNTDLLKYIPEAHINRNLVKRLLCLDPDCYYSLPDKWKHDYASGFCDKSNI